MCSSDLFKLLADTGTLNQQEIAGAKKVLDAAALTYVAATLMAVMQLLSLIIRSRGRRD